MTLNALDSEDVFGNVWDVFQLRISLVLKRSLLAQRSFIYCSKFIFMKFSHVQNEPLFPEKIQNENHHAFFYLGKLSADL